MAIDPRFYFGTIEAGTRLGLGTADIWSLIRDQAENAGLASPGVTAQDVSRMRGQAGAIREADRQLTKAPGGYGIENTMIGTAPWARPDAQRNTVPMFQVRFQHTTRDAAGEERTEWRNMMITGELPATVDDLQRRGDQAGQQMAKDYELEHLDVGAISILRV